MCLTTNNIYLCGHGFSEESFCADYLADPTIDAISKGEVPREYADQYLQRNPCPIDEGTHVQRGNTNCQNCAGAGRNHSDEVTRAPGSPKMYTHGNNSKFATPPPVEKPKFKFSPTAPVFVPRGMAAFQGYLGLPPTPPMVATQPQGLPPSAMSANPVPFASQYEGFIPASNVPAYLHMPLSSAGNPETAGSTVDSRILGYFQNQQVAPGSAACQFSRQGNPQARPNQGMGWGSQSRES